MTLKIIELNKFKTAKGNLLKFVNKKFKYFKKFGEVYFNEIKKNKKSDWIYHKKNQCLVSVIKGTIEFEFNLSNKKKKIILSRNNLRLVVIPKKTWFRFKAKQNNSIMVNLINEMHADSEVIKTEKISI